MRLVIEDDSGAAWYVTEELEEIKLDDQESIDYIINQIREVQQQIQEEGIGYLDNLDKEEDEQEETPDPSYEQKFFGDNEEDELEDENESITT